MTNIFNTPTDDNEQIESYRELLVGEGKKFKDDEALAKGKYEADKYAKRLEAEAAELRQQLNTRLTLEEFMTKNLERPAPSNQTPPEMVEQRGNDEGKVSLEEYRKIASEEYRKNQALEQRARNADISIKKMKEAWGTNATERLNKVSSDLHLGQDFLQDLAERSPEAFLHIIGAAGNTNQRDNFAPPRSSTNSAAVVSQGNESRNEAYWEKIKASDPKFYYSAQGYNARHNDAMKLGADWFSK